MIHLSARNWDSVHVLAGWLDRDLLNNSLELGGGDLNLVDLGLKSLVLDVGVRVGQGVVVGICVGGTGNDWVVKVGVVVGSKGGGGNDWGDFLNLGLLSRGSFFSSWGSFFYSGGSLFSSGGSLFSSWGSLFSSRGSLFGSRGSLFSSRGSFFSSRGSLFGSGGSFLFSLSLGLGAWDRGSKAILASGINKFNFVGLDLDLVLLGDELVDDRLVVVDQWCGEGVRVGERKNHLVLLGDGDCDSDNKDQLQTLNG